MTSKYAVYPVYGEDEGRLVLGSSKALVSDIPYHKGEVIKTAYAKCNTNDFVIIDWKHYKVKHHLNGRTYIWESFKSSEFWRMFRFTTPCEDWEIQAYGHIR